MCIITNTGTELKLVERSDCIVQWLLQNQCTQEFRLTGTKFLHFKLTASIWKLKHKNIMYILNFLVFVVLGASLSPSALRPQTHLLYKHRMMNVQYGKIVISRGN